MQAIWYFFGTRPSPFFGITDFYVLNPISRLVSKKWKVSELGLRDRLGGGNFGQVYEGVIASKDVEIKRVKQLTTKQKKRRVVLKKVNLDRVEVRADFLRAGTMAKVGLATPICFVGNGLAWQLTYHAEATHCLCRDDPSVAACIEEVKHTTPVHMHPNKSTACQMICSRCVCSQDAYAHGVPESIPASVSLPLALAT